MDDDKSTWMTLNERRAELGYEPVPWLDFLRYRKREERTNNKRNEETQPDLGEQNRVLRLKVNRLANDIKELEKSVERFKNVNRDLMTNNQLLANENTKLNKENEELLDRVEELQALLESLNSLGSAPRRNGQRGID